METERIVTRVLQKWHAPIHVDVARELDADGACPILDAAVTFWRAANGLPADITPPNIAEFRIRRPVIDGEGSSPWRPGQDIPRNVTDVFVVVYPIGNPMVEYVPAVDPVGRYSVTDVEGVHHEVEEVTTLDGQRHELIVQKGPGA